MGTAMDAMRLLNTACATSLCYYENLLNGVEKLIILISLASKRTFSHWEIEGVLCLLAGLEF